MKTNINLTEFQSSKLRIEELLNSRGGVSSTSASSRITRSTGNDCDCSRRDCDCDDIAIQ